MEKILVSACLLGEKTRYDGKGNYNPEVREAIKDYEVILVCPEVFGGLSTPRLKSEIRGSKVVNEEGKDVTRYFEKGVLTSLEPVKYFGIKKAILKENSPSCGVNSVYDGTFRKKLVDGNGFLTKELKKLGVRVFSENELEEFKK